MPKNSHWNSIVISFKYSTFHRFNQIVCCGSCHPILFFVFRPVVTIFSIYNIQSVTWTNFLVVLVACLIRWISRKFRQNRLNRKNCAFVNASNTIHYSKSHDSHMAIYVVDSVIKLNIIDITNRQTTKLEIITRSIDDESHLTNNHPNNWRYMTKENCWSTCWFAQLSNSFAQFIYWMRNTQQFLLLFHFVNVWSHHCYTSNNLEKAADQITSHAHSHTHKHTFISITINWKSRNCQIFSTFIQTTHKTYTHIPFCYFSFQHHHIIRFDSIF